MAADYDNCLQSALTILQHLQIMSSNDQITVQLVRDESSATTYPCLLISPQEEAETFTYLSSITKLQKYPVDVTYIDRVDLPGTTLIPTWFSVRQSITDAFPNKTQPNYPTNVIGCLVEPKVVAESQAKPYQRVLGALRIWFQTLRPV